MAVSRKRNPGLFRTRKEAVANAIARAERDSSRALNRSGNWYVVGGARRWSVVCTPPVNSAFFGPITVENAPKYRKWYC